MAATITSFRGPFPTDYEVPEDCSGIAGSDIFRYDFDPTCLPKDFDPDPTAIYSPGTACPSGYTAQDTCTHSSGSTTTLICCPQRGDLTLACVDDPNSLTGPFTSLWCTWSAGTHQTVLLATDEDETRGVTFTGADGVNAYGLKMVYEPTDIETAETTTETGGATSGPQVTGEGDSEDDSGGLATGAIVAIAVVIPVVLIAMAIGAFFWYRKRKHSKAAASQVPGMHEAPGSHASPSTAYGSQYYGGASSNGTPYPPNAQQGPYSYASVPNGPPAVAPQEMPAQTFVSELPGDEQPGQPKYR